MAYPYTEMGVYNVSVPLSAMSWDGFSGVRVLSLPGEVAYATSHGVYLTDEQVSGLLGNVVF